MPYNTMEALSAQLIILATTKVGEKSLVAHTLSSDFGRRSFLLSVGRSTPSGLLQPLSIVDAEIVPNPRSELWRAHALSTSFPLTSLRTEAGKSAIVMFLSEVLFRAVREGTYEEGLYEWCRASILTLDSLEGDWANFHLVFLLELAAAMGFAATLADLAPFSEGCLAQMKALVQTPRAEALLLPMNGRERSAVASALLDYLSFHTESRINVRSLKVLGEILR